MTVRAGGARSLPSLLAFLPFTALLLGVAALADVRRNDFFQFWWAGHLVATGRSPYEPASFRDALSYGAQAGSVYANCAASADAPACLWVYPPWTAWLYVPLGFLDAAAGPLAVLILSAVGLGIGIALVTRWAAVPAAGTAILAIGLCVSAPAVRDVVTGHFEGLLLVGLVSLEVGLARGRGIALVTGVVLMALKPHLFIGLAAAVVAWLLAGRRYAALAAAAVTLGALALVAFSLEPRALPAILERSASKADLTGTTTWHLAERIGGPSAPVVAAALVAIALWSSLVAWRAVERHEQPRALVAIGMALSLVLAPYAQSYDDVLLFPAVALAVRGLSARSIALAAAGLVALTWGAYVLELAGDPRAYAGLLPAIALAALALRRRWR